MNTAQSHMGLTCGDQRLSFTGKRWVWPAATTPTQLLPRLLRQRGLVGAEDIRGYLSPSLANLDDPASMADMAVAVARLCHAVAAGEAITVYGDYDVDGVCSTAILVGYLRGVGAKVAYYIPDRRAEGYGLNAAAIETLAPRTQVLITTDCGITAHDEIALANRLGCDVIVVDHHQVGPRLPEACACLNPHRRDCGFPYKHLCAAGVAFMLTVGLRRAMRQEKMFGSGAEPDLRTLLDLVAVATVADMVPLTGTNRLLVRAGLRHMASTRRVGLRALAQVAQVDLERVSASDLGFRVGPRINARGRISQAAQAVDLLLTEDAARAQQLAGVLDAANRTRQDIETQTLAEAAAQIDALGLAKQAAIVIHDETWHAGVLGLVASRLVSRFQRPAIAIGEGGKGSGRSVEGFDLYGCLREHASHLLAFGGHPAAAGLTIVPEGVAAFRSAFAASVAQHLGSPPFVAVLRPDAEIDAGQLSLPLVRDLEQLSPFGQGNPAPLFVASNLSVRGARVVGNAHLKLALGSSGHDAIAFGMGELASHLPPRCDVVFVAERNFFRGRESLQLRVQDLRPAAQS